MCGRSVVVVNFKEMNCIFILFYYHPLNRLSAGLTRGNKINIAQTFPFLGEHKTNQNITECGFSEDDLYNFFFIFLQLSVYVLFPNQFDFFFFSPLRLLSHPTSSHHLRSPYQNLFYKWKFAKFHHKIGKWIKFCAALHFVLVTRNSA